MISVNQSETSVNPAVQRRGPGQPTKQTPVRIQAINRALVEAALRGDTLPSDSELAAAHGISERLVRDIRLRILGLNRHALKGWQGRAAVLPSTSCSSERELICWTPYAGLWLLVPQIIAAGLVRAAQTLQIVGRTRVQAIEIVLSLIVVSALGVRRLFHLEDYRGKAELGLALFTGGLRLRSDSTLWRWIHGVTTQSAASFYQITASEGMRQGESRGRFSLDEHIVPSFTHRQPRPLAKTRVPTRGRAYPAFRLYASYDLDRGRFVALLVRQARQALSQVLPDLLNQLRCLRQRAQVSDPAQVHLIFDRGGYKGSLFEKLMQDPQVSFIAMARATQVNVRQWETIPEHYFRLYQPTGDDNPNLKIARCLTAISGCRYPLLSVVIRDDTPATRQRWRVLFCKPAPGERVSSQAIDAAYRSRQHHELGFSQYVHALGGHSLPKAYQMLRVPNRQGQKRCTVATAENDASQQAVHLVAWIKFLTFNLIKDFGAALGEQQAKWQVATLVRRYIARPGRLYLHNHCLIVQLDPFRGDAALLPFIQQLNQRQLPIPWFAGLILQVEIASQPQGLAATPFTLSQRILANSHLADPP